GVGLAAADAVVLAADPRGRLCSGADVEGLSELGGGGLSRRGAGGGALVAARLADRDGRVARGVCAVPAGGDMDRNRLGGGAGAPIAAGAICRAVRDECRDSGSGAKGRAAGGGGRPRCAGGSVP